MLVEGYGLQEVMGCPGVDGINTKTNNILEMQARASWVRLSAG